MAYFFISSVSVRNCPAESHSAQKTHPYVASWLKVFVINFCLFDISPCQRVICQSSKNFSWFFTLQKMAKSWVCIHCVTTTTRTKFWVFSPSPSSTSSSASRIKNQFQQTSTKMHWNKQTNKLASKVYLQQLRYLEISSLCKFVHTFYICQHTCMSYWLVWVAWKVLYRKKNLTYLLAC